MNRNNVSMTCLYAGVILLMILWEPQAQAAVVFLKDGRAQCTIVVGREDSASFVYTMEHSSVTRALPSQVLTKAAQDLADHLNDIGQIWDDADKVQRKTRQEPVKTEYRILLGNAAIEEYGLAEEAALLPYPAYIYRVKGNDLLIFGSSSKGTANGIYGFLQDELGVRWFGPQDDFCVIPRRATISVDNLDRKVIPSFFGNRDVEERIEYPSYLWARRMRMPEAIDVREPFINVNHNLYKVFPPSRYFDSHPEYYAMRRGRRRLNEPKSWNWSLCWSNPDVVKIATAAAKAFFRPNPQNHTFSLGINDTNGYCECAACAKLQPQRSFRGNRVASDMYYHFVNQVAKAVKEEFPDRYIGTIAYNDVTLPPACPVAKNVHVVIVTDISEYFDANYHAQEEELLSAWQKKGISLGLYYYLGLAKLVPAYFPHLLADVLKNAYRQGFTSIYSEKYPGWPWTGPMVYLEGRLLWDAELNADDVLREYFSTLYGPAAKPIEDLYRLFEEIHLRPRKGGFLYEHYKLLQFRPYTGTDLQRMRELLAQAHDAVRDLGTGYTGREGKEGQRVAYVSNGLKVFLEMLEGYSLANDIKAPGTLNDFRAMGKLEAIRRVNAIMKGHRALYRETILADKNQSRRYTRDTCPPLREQWMNYLSSAVGAATVDLDKWSRSGVAAPLIRQGIERELAHTQSTRN